MIRDLLVLTKSGMSLVSAYFGECHSLGPDVMLTSGFVSAVLSFGQELTGQEVKRISFGDLHLLFQARDQLLMLIAVDDDDFESNQVKLQRIADLFFENYGDLLEDGHFMGNLTPFEGFRDLLIELNIAQKNCGGRPECKGCPNSKKSFPLSRILNFFRRRKR